MLWVVPGARTRQPTVHAMSRVGRLAGVALCCVLALTPARAGATDDAVWYYQLGMAAMEAGAWERAAAAFDAAAAHDGAVELVWNAARAWDKAGVAGEARERYVRFLAHADAPADLRRFAVSRVEALTSEVEGALARAREEDHARLASRLAAELRAEVAGAEGRPLAASGHTFAARPEVEAVHVEEGGGGDGARVAGWVAVGIGVVGVGVGAVMLAEAARFDGELRDATRDDRGVIVGLTPREAVRLAERRDDARDVGVVGLAVGGALLTAGVLALLLAADDGPPTRVGLGVAGGGVGLTLGGAF